MRTEFESTVGYFQDPYTGQTRKYTLLVNLKPAQMKTDIHLKPVPEGALELSFMGEIPNYSSGQNIDDLRKVTAYEKKGWNEALVNKVIMAWERWHLNGARAGCVHQLVNRWDERPIDPLYPTNAYGKFFHGQRMDSWNMLVWIRRDEHPEGLLAFPCETCGYKYGSQWLHEMLPQRIIDLVHSLPRNP